MKRSFLTCGTPLFKTKGEVGCKALSSPSNLRAPIMHPRTVSCSLKNRMAQHYWGVLVQQTNEWVQNSTQFEPHGKKNQPFLESSWQMACSRYAEDASEEAHHGLEAIHASAVCSFGASICDPTLKWPTGWSFRNGIPDWGTKLTGNGHGLKGACKCQEECAWKLDNQSEMTNSDVLGFQEYPLRYLAKAYRAYMKSENLENSPKGRSQRKNGGECFAPLLCI